jgi:pimeloyl-ACP methyl ester carboxylesterase
VTAVSYPTLASGELAQLRDVDDFAFHLSRLLDDRGIEQATLVGSSLGGWLAADFAARYPKTVRALVLIAPAGLRHPDARGEDVFYVPITELPALLMADPASADLSAIPALDPATETGDAMVMLTEGLETLARFGWSPYLNDPRLRERVVRYTGPVLVLWGSEDAVLPVAHADLWVEAVDCELQVLDGVGHLAALEQPAAVLDAITGWLHKDDRST